MRDVTAQTDPMKTLAQLTKIPTEPLIVTCPNANCQTVFVHPMEPESLEILTLLKFLK